MIDNMFTIMKRINEIKGRFGINKRRQARPSAPSAKQDGYQAFQKKAVEGRNRALESGTTGVATIKGGSIDEIKKLAEHYASANRVPPALVKAVIEAESDYNPRAVSPKGAKGLMQLMPSVIEDLGVRNPFDPAENISAGVSLLKGLLNEYNGDYKKALSAYNAGRKTVNENGGTPEYRETREYVKKVLDAYMKNSG